MLIEFLKAHNLKENRKSYKAGDTEYVSSSIAKRLKDDGIAKDAVQKEVVQKDPKTKQSK